MTSFAPSKYTHTRAMIKRLVILFLVLISLYSFSQKGPGGVSLESGSDSNNKVWLDASQLALSDGDLVSLWPDLSLSVNDNSPSQNNNNLKPTFRSDISAGINGKPILKFGNGKMLLFVTKDDINNQGPYTERTTFIGIRTSADVNTRQMIYEQGGTVRGLNIFIFNGKLFMGGYDRANDPDGTPTWNYTYTTTPIAPKTTYVISHVFYGPTGSTSGYIKGYLNGVQFASAATGVGSLWTHPNAPGIGAINSDSYNENGAIYNATSQQPFLGDIAEMIAYDEVLNNAERIIVENYLGAKYYSNIIVNDKYDHQLSYGNEVIGIGRKNGSSNQHNISQGRNSFEIKANNSNFQNNEFLLMGCDHKDNTVWTDVDAPNFGVNTKRLERVWRADHRGNLGNITFTLDASLVPNKPSGYTKYVLIVDRNGGLTPNFNNDQTDVIELTHTTGNLYSTATPIQDGAYITIGVVKPTIEFALDHDYGFEANVNVNASVEVTLNYITTSGPVTFAYEFQNNTANNPTDYFGVNNVTNIPNGQQSKNINFTITGDFTNENTEQLSIVLVDGGGMPYDFHTFYIYDNDHTPKLKFDALSSTVNENANDVLVDVVRTGDNSLMSSCNYRLRTSGGSGTADENLDYTYATGSLVFGVGQNIKHIPLTILNDVNDEYNETIILELYNISFGSDFETDYVEHVLTIMDNDAPPTVQFVLTEKENYESVGLPLIKIQLSNKSQKDITVQHELLGSSTATQGLDHTLASLGVIGFSAGDSIVDLPMIVVNDGFQEPDETIIVRLNNNSQLVNASLGSNIQHTYTIIDYESFEHSGVAGIGTLPDNAIWLCADSLNASHNSKIKTWNDLSTNGNNAYQNTNNKRPLLKVSASTMNGFKTLNFDGSNDYYTINNSNEINQGTFESKYVFMVIRTGNNVTNRQVLFEQGNKDRGLNIYIRNGRLYFHAYNTANDDAGATTPWGGSGWANSKNIWGAISTNTEYVISFMYDYNNVDQLEGFINGVSQGTISDGSIGRLFSHPNTHLAGAPSQIRFHDTPTSGSYFKGQIAEFLYLSNAPVNKARRVILESYFSGKYDIAMATDYYSSITHKFDIAGIGKFDENSDHIDSQGPDAMVRIKNASTLSDGDYLVWGHDNGALVLNKGNVPTGIQNRMHRTWFVRETQKNRSASGVGTVTLSFNLSGFIINSSTHLKLLIDNDGDFTNATSHTMGRTYNPSSQTLSFTGVDLSDGKYFTLGSTSSETPLPVTLVAFEAETEKQDVKLSWVTSSEVNNDYFYIEKTMDGKTFEYLGRVKGSGNANYTNEYELYDENPYMGTTYYRLVQVDFDGTKTPSDLVSVNFENENQAQISIYPNPAQNISDVNIALSGFQSNEKVQVVITDIIGNTLYSNYTLIDDNGKVLFKADGLDHLGSGSYVVTVRSTHKTFNQKLIIK